MGRSMMRANRYACAPGHLTGIGLVHVGLNADKMRRHARTQLIDRSGCVSGLSYFRLFSSNIPDDRASFPHLTAVNGGSRCLTICRSTMTTNRGLYLLRNFIVDGNGRCGLPAIPLLTHFRASLSRCAKVRRPLMRRTHDARLPRGECHVVRLSGDPVTIVIVRKEWVHRMPSKDPSATRLRQTQHVYVAEKFPSLP